MRSSRPERRSALALLFASGFLLYAWLVLLAFQIPLGPAIHLLLVGSGALLLVHFGRERGKAKASR
jgi:hypothetical protein